MTLGLIMFLLYENSLLGTERSCWTGGHRHKENSSDCLLQSFRHQVHYWACLWGCWNFRVSLLCFNQAAVTCVPMKVFSLSPSFCHYSLLDFLTLLSFDYHGHWDPVTGHNSPLFRSSLDTGNIIHHNIVRSKPLNSKCINSKCHL